MESKNFAESWKNLYQDYIGTVNFAAGDFETLKSAIRQYIVNQIPENYTDFSDSSEVGMFSNSIAYLGENLHYRVDLSVHNLFPQTTERKQALLDFVKMLSYFPSRNICALGLGKIISLQTDEEIEDSLGKQLKNQTIKWNDSTNENWQEQFLTVINASLVSTNQFGNPKKTDVVDNVTTQLYQMNSLVNNECCFSFTRKITDKELPFNVVNSDIDLKESSVYEPTPVPENAFNFIYRNDGAGNKSVNTGFFVMWKQGRLVCNPYKFTSKEKNIRISLNLENVNENDVWFSELDTNTGLTTNIWTKLDKDEYLSYNNREITNKNLFKVETKIDDKIDVVFGDGNFANIPFGTYNLWTRISNGNDDIYIKPDDMQNIVVNIPYKSQNTKDTNTYTLTFVFSVASFEHIRQATSSETISNIRNAAPEVYSTQNRMISNTDYNRYPLTVGNQVVVLKSLLRTYAGNSRYIKLTDPTGTYTGINLVGKDGFVYGYTTTNIVSMPIRSEEDATKLIMEVIQPNLIKVETESMYYDNYTGFLVPSDSEEEYNVEPLQILGGTSFTCRLTSTEGIVKYETVKDVCNIGDIFCLKNEDGEISWVTIQGLNEKETQEDYELIISPTPDLSKKWHIRNIDDGESWSKYSYFKKTLGELVDELISKLQSPPKPFGITYDSVNMKWIMSTDLSDDAKMVDIASESNVSNRAKLLNWFFRFTYNTSGEMWTIESRSKYYVFGSNGETTFYFDNSKIDSNGYFITKDYLKVIGVGNKEYTFKPYDSFSYPDGYVNNVKFKARSYDFSTSLNTINPLQFKEMISNKKNTIIFEKDTDTQVGSKISFIDRCISKQYGYDSMRGSMWECTTKSGYYYCKYKCNYIKAGNVLDKNIWQPHNKGGYTVLSNGQFAYFEGSTFKVNTKYDYDIIDYIDHYEGEAGSYTPVFYGDEGYLYYFNAKTKTLTEMDRKDFDIEEGVDNMLFLWVHYPTEKQTIDPCATNIIDMYALPTTYYNEVNDWLSNGKQGSFPTAPTSYEIESIFKNIEDKKAMGDEMIWHPVVYKLIFGYGSASRNKCIFKIIKKNDLVSDNEIKQLVVKLIDNYISTLSVGESLYFSKLSTYIHSNSSDKIQSIRIVSSANTNENLNMYEIGCEDNELLLSTATVSNIQIISTNLD